MPLVNLVEEKHSDCPHRSTLFVSNLPYTATSIDLQTLFSDIAPVRTAFVVTEHGTGISKGVGYVSFALKEDAENAYTMISEKGTEFLGRKLRVQWAENQVCFSLCMHFISANMLLEEQGKG